VVGDVHMRDALGYNDQIDRTQEEQNVLDFIISSFSDCQKIVFIGDIFNSCNPSSEVVRKAVNFIERFDNKELFFVSGNHDKFGNGKSALNFLKEIKNKSWHIITNEVEMFNNMVFCPYFFKGELEAKDDKAATVKVMKKLKDNPGNILFVHHSISDSMTASGINTNFFPEVVLPKKKLEELYKLVVGGHIHHHSMHGQTIVTGSIFNQEINETGKMIYKINEETLEVVQITLPGRKIYGLTNPTDKDLELDKNSIVKVTITEKLSHAKLDELRDKLKVFDAFILLEHVPSERKQIHLEDGGNMLEFDILQLLEIYSQEKKADINKLKQAFELIK
jgi:DNA repair exonuclease SbcCD nuclease subunit